jgi:uncharacterized protein involved in exopolysaccharide biosynthesis
VPDHKSAPKRVPMILLGATVGLALSIFYAAIRSLLSSWKIERIRRGAISVSEA